MLAFLSCKHAPNPANRNQPPSPFSCAVKTSAKPDGRVHCVPPRIIANQTTASPPTGGRRSTVPHPKPQRVALKQRRCQMQLAHFGNESGLFGRSAGDFLSQRIKIRSQRGLNLLKPKRGQAIAVRDLKNVISKPRCGRLPSSFPKIF